MIPFQPFFDGVGYGSTVFLVFDTLVDFWLSGCVTVFFVVIERYAEDAGTALETTLLEAAGTLPTSQRTP